MFLTGWLPAMGANMRLHGNCVARDNAGVLILGASGSGKSDLTLRLLDRGFALVADDQVEINDNLVANAPLSLAGLLEVRGLGIVRLPFVREVKLQLIVALTAQCERLPVPERHGEFNLPMIRVLSVSASAPEIVSLALDCAMGRVTQQAGAFAA